MTTNTTLRVTMSILILVLGNLQAWNSGVPEAGLLIVLLVSVAIALPSVALLVPIPQRHAVSTLVLSLILVFLARHISPNPLPGLFIVLVPAAMGLIFASVPSEESERH